MNAAPQSLPPTEVDDYGETMCSGYRAPLQVIEKNILLPSLNVGPVLGSAFNG